MSKKLSQAEQNVVDVLNKARSMELTAIHQYMANHYDLDDMDYGKLANKVREAAIAEMHHAEMFAERIKEIGGVPTTELAAKVIKGQTPEEMFTYDSQLEEDTIKSYNEFIKVCADNNDNVSKSLFQKIITIEQEHYNTFDDVHSHMTELGKSYLSRMTGSSED